ncbi:MAG: cellulase family glycosylhydrolase [Cytophagaceae bacterium]|nr:cellulase family glycosylhydrolase [Cytophagaceae bacterium]
MKTNKLLFSLKLLGIFMCLLNPGGLFAQTPVAKNGQLRVSGTKLVNQYGNPIQLRGMSSHGIQWYGWGKCLTAASLDAVANDWGADIFRIAMYIQEGGYEANPTAYTNQVHTLINEVSNRGMYALVDFHMLNPGDPNYNLERAKTFFTAIANQHKDKNNIIYEICNEPNGVSWATIKSYADQLIPVIRAIDSDAIIIVGTPGWSSLGVSGNGPASTIISNPLNYPNIMYTFHFYAASHKDNYYNEVNSFSNSLPVFVTEFGTQTASGDGTNDFVNAQKYIDLFRTKKISWVNWNYSDDGLSGAVWTPGTCSNGPWTTARLKPAGTWVRDKMLNPADDFPGAGTPNTPPTVSISSPANGSSFTAPASITINATASDADGSVSKVDFYNGTTLLSSDNAAPYSYTWSNVAAGSYSITAKATDNSGAVTTSAAVNVSVTSAPVSQSPYGGTVRSIPGKIEAEHYDLGGQNVAYNDATTANEGAVFRTDAVDIEATTDAGAGYNVGWTVAGEWLEYTVNVTAAGTYKLDARVAAITAGKTFHVEMDGQNVSGVITVPNTAGWQTWATVSVTTTSLTAGQKVMRIVMDAGEFNLNHVTFTATTNPPAPNTPPAVSITSPSNNTSFIAPATINITANASDADGTVSKVEFFNGATKLGEDLTAPYSFSWTNVPAGSYSLTAKATDNAAAVTTSSAVSVQVSATPPPTNKIPTASITSPANGASFTAPATIAINASASDADGTISKVDFYNGTTLLGSDATAPYSFTISNAAAGTYSLKAVATDNLNATGSSAVVTVTVTSNNPPPTTVGINGPNCAKPGVATTFTLKPEAGFTTGSWWTTGEATVTVDATTKQATITYTGNALGTLTISCGANFSTAPWYKEYTKTITVSNTCATAAKMASPNVVTTPQPFNDEATVSVDNGETMISVKLYDMQGNQIISMDNVNLNEVSLGNDLKAGIYILKVVTENGTYTQRIIKSK